jgi:hypothetical protein
MATVPYGPGQGNPLNVTARLLPVGGWPAEGPHIGMSARNAACPYVHLVKWRAVSVPVVMS